MTLTPEELAAIQERDRNDPSPHSWRQPMAQVVADRRALLEHIDHLTAAHRAELDALDSYRGHGHVCNSSCAPPLHFYYA